MSAETLEWLNENVMFGYAATRSTWGAGTSFGNGTRPWFATDEYEHLYDGPIPIEAVRDNLFYWTPEEADITVRFPTVDASKADGIAADGSLYRDIIDAKRKAIVRPDTQEVLGIFGRDSYKIHNYEEWLLTNVASLLDSSITELGISSAGLLRSGGQAWVSIELPEDIAIAGAGHIRPCIVAATSLDGTLATTYATRLMRPECDNSLRLSLSQEGNTLKIKHSSRSLGRIVDARSALGIIHTMSELAEQWFDALADVDVTDAKFRQIVQGLAPVPDPKVENGKVTNQRSITLAVNKQDDLTNLWRSDPRAAPWNGTLAGAFHAVNTWQQHYVPRDDNQVRRQMTGTLSGSFDKMDTEFWNLVRDLDIPLPTLAAA